MGTLIANPAMPVLIRPYRAIVGSLPASASQATFTGGSSTSNSVDLGGVSGELTPAQTFVLQADAVIEEEHYDEMVMTENPVEAGQSGAVVTDHIYRLPSELQLVYSWAMASIQNSDQNITFLNQLYNQFLNIEQSGILVQVYTGKRFYKNMAIRVLSTTSDMWNENIIKFRIGLKEIIIATTQTVTLGSPIGNIANQANPEQTAPTVQQGARSLQPGSNFNPAGLLPQGGS